MRGILTNMHRQGSKIHINVRCEDGEKRKAIINDFRPYFYVPSDDGNFQSIFGEKLSKIYVSDPSDVPKMRENYISHYEADIPYTRRFLIDRNIRLGVELLSDSEVISINDIRAIDGVDIKPEIYYLDVEVGSDKFIPSTEASEEIILLSLATEDKVLTFIKAGVEKIEKKNNSIVMFVESEYDLLWNFSRFLLKFEPDIIIGWNLNYDLEYLENRLKIHKISINLSSLFDTFDFYEAYRKLYKQPTYRLNDVATYEGFEQRENILEWDSAYKAYQKGDYGKIIYKYNQRHVKWLVELDRKHNLFEFYHRLKVLSGVASMKDTLITSVLLDTMFLRLAKKRGVVLPSTHERDVRTYRGAIVFDAPKGIFYDVADFDMSRYYPSIILSFNLSPETIVEDGDIRLENGLGIKLNPLGIVPELVAILIEERNKLENEMNRFEPGTPEYRSLESKMLAVKYMTNAVYGYLAFRNSRIFRPEIAETISSIAREGLIKSKEIFEQHGYRVLYGDTDSIFVSIPFDRVNEMINIINKEVANHLIRKYGIQNCAINMKIDAYLKTIFFTGTKKKHAEHIIWKKGKGKCDYVSVTGFETIRSDQSDFTKNVQRTLIEMIVKRKEKNEIIKYVEMLKDEFRKQPIEEIALRRGISKSFSKYSVKPPHIRGSLLANMYLGTNIRPGDKVKMLYVKRLPGVPKTDVICFENIKQIPEGTEIDWQRMIEVSLKMKIEPILDVFGIKITWFSKTQQENLMSWL